ncbi:MAG: UbiA prenyltransferase family protein [Patescibacteria group bacterium]|nr:UbiA prenyltransferase family protein [Patescibacteria group bacterium]
MEHIWHIVVAARPRQWIKNLGLFIPLVLDGKLLHGDKFLTVCLGVIAFSLLSSSNYIINDILDAGSDKQHPYKKHRPIARNDLPLHIALGAALLFGIIGFILSFFIGQVFLLIAFFFVLLHYLSYFFFRSIPVIDVLMIASGYVLRIMAGEKAAGVVMSVWLFLTGLSASLFLAIGKRRSELSLVKNFRSGYFHYSENLLDSYLAVFACSSFLSYSYFTFLSTMSEEGMLFRGYTDYVFPMLGRKWMMLTIPFVLYGIMRYVQLVYSGKEILINMVTKDRSLVITALLWITVILFVVYGIGG